MRSSRHWRQSSLEQGRYWHVRTSWTASCCKQKLLLQSFKVGEPWQFSLFFYSSGMAKHPEWDLYQPLPLVERARATDLSIVRQPCKRQAVYPSSTSLIKYSSPQRRWCPWHPAEMQDFLQPRSTIDLGSGGTVVLLFLVFSPQPTPHIRSFVPHSASSVAWWVHMLIIRYFLIQLAQGQRIVDYKCTAHLSSTALKYHYIVEFFCTGMSERNLHFFHSKSPDLLDDYRSYSLDFSNSSFLFCRCSGIWHGFDCLCMYTWKPFWSQLWYSLMPSI